MNLREYQDFVLTTFIPEADPKYNLMRAGLELAEEYLEWNHCSLENEVSELGDMLYWCAMLANLLNIDLYPIVSYDNWMMSQTVGDILGKIKRVYRDGRQDCLLDIKRLTNEMFTHIHDYSNFDEILKKNVSKLTRRSLDGTIQGSGDR